MSSKAELLAAAFIHHLLYERRLSPLTSKNYARDIGVLLSYSGEINLGILQSADVRQVIAKLHGKGLSGRSLARMLSAWRSFYDYLIRDHHYQHNPCIGLRVPKSAQKLPSALSPDEARQLLAFQDAQAWLNDASGRVYHIEAWQYPLTVSLIALWSALAAGQWQDSIVHLPWWACGVALGLGGYGQARLWGVTPLQAMVFAWLLLSLPLVNVHMALAGYADLWLTAAFGFSAIAFMHWIRWRDRRQGILAILLAVFCASIKQEGMVWPALLIPALLLVLLPKRYVLALAGLAVLLFGLILGLGGLGDFGFADSALIASLLQRAGIRQFHLVYWNNWQPVIDSLLILDNWHLLGYLLLMTLLAVVGLLFRQTWIRAAGQQQRALGATTLLILTLGAAFFGLFFFTQAGKWAEDFTSINRIILHFTPVLLFWALTVFAMPRASAGLGAQSVVSVRR